MLRSLNLGALGTAPWAPVRELAPSAPPDQADVVVVGAGMSGLSAAWHLAGRGVSVVVVDRRFGTGATTRSGGIILGDTLEGPAAGFERCEQVLGAWIGAHHIACDFQWTRCLELTRDHRLNGDPIAWTDHGAVRATGTVAAALVDPVKLLNGLSLEVERAGVAVVSGCSVAGLAHAGPRIEIEANTGRIRARHAVMAVDAVSWRTERDPWPLRTLTVVLQTAPADPDVHTAIGLAAGQPFYTNEAPLLWGRTLPDHSFMFGRELVPFPWSESGEDLESLVAGAGERLAARVHGLHPRLAGLGVRRVWAGPTARTAAGVPLLAEDPDVPSVTWMGGYGGHGLAQAFTLGRRIADRVHAALS